MKPKTTKDLPIGHLPETGFIRKNQLFPYIVPIAYTTAWRWMKEGKFPAPVQISPRLSLWRVEDIREWLKSA